MKEDTFIVYPVPDYIRDFYFSIINIIVGGIKDECRSNTMSKGKIKTNKMVKVSLLAAISYILTFIRIPLPLFPEYLKLDIAELPALIGSFSLGQYMV